MNRVPLLLIGDSREALASLRTIAEPIVAAHPGFDACLEADAKQLIEERARFPEGCVAWASLSGSMSKADRFELTAQAQDRHIPLALHEDNQTDLPSPGQSALNGSVVLPPDADPAVIAAVLGTLASQASALDLLGRENQLLRAHHGGMAEQIGRIDEELRMAVKIQREFLPKALPEIGDFGFDVLWRPAGYVSGDIYDVARLDEHHFGFFIADAVGHGVPAALMTIYIKQALRTKKIEPNARAGYRLLEPAETLMHLNRALLEQNGGSTCFATAAYGVVDARTGQTTLARAGHPLPRVLRHSGDTEALTADGPMLGVFDTDEFEQQTFLLHPGDRMLLFSDGFEMAFPEAIGGEHPASVANEKYIDALENLRSHEPAQAMQRFAADLDAQHGSLNQKDDLTLLCVSLPAHAKLAEPEELTSMAEAFAA